MEKILKLDLNNIDVVVEKYNNDKVSKELIQYMVDSVPFLDKNDVLKVVINNKIKGNVCCVELIKKGLDEACEKNDSKFHNTNRKQLTFLVMGIIALIVASVIEWNVLKEIVIIGAWVLLWDVVEMEIVDDISNRRRKRILKKLLSSEFIENMN